MQLIGHPQVMKLATRHGLPRPLLMRFTLKLLANLTDPRGGDAQDRVITALTKLAARGVSTATPAPGCASGAPLGSGAPAAGDLLPGARPGRGERRS